MNKSYLVIAMALALSACSNPQAACPEGDTACQAAAQQSQNNGMMGFFGGALLGHMLSGGSRQPVAPAYASRPVMNHTTIVKQRVVYKAPPPKTSSFSSPSYRPSVSRPSFSRSSFGSSRSFGGSSFSSRRR